jgi:ferredoxin
VEVPTEEARQEGRYQVRIRLFRDTRAGADASRPEWSFSTDGAAPILDDALERGMDASYGCRMGSCGMCAGRLVTGEVDQSGQVFLDEAQIAAGYVLLCQARPLSDVAIEVCTTEEIDAL